MRKYLLVTLFAAACGKTTSLVDGPRGDGNGADAANTIDADAHGVVTVIVNDIVRPSLRVVSGQPVAFIEPDGTVEPIQMSGSDGKASYSVLAGASVVTAYGLGTSNMQVEMVRGVKPGDTITIGPAPGAATSGSFTVNITPIFLSQSYDIYGPCGSTNVPDPGSGATTAAGALTMYDDCMQANMDLVAVLNNNDGIPDSYVEQANVAYTNGGSATMPSTWIPLQQNTTNYTNMPAGINAASFELHVPDINGYPASRYNFASGGSTIMNTSSPVAQHALEIEQIAGDNGTQTIYQQIAGTPAQYDVDWSTVTLLPWIAVPTLDVTTGKVTTTVTGTGGGDVFNAQVEFNRPNASQGVDFVAWDIWTESAGDVTLPVLPDPMTAVNVLSTDSPDFATAALFDADAVTSYDQIRGDLWSAFQAYYAGRGTTGALRVSDSNTVGASLRGVHPHF